MISLSVVEVVEVGHDDRDRQGDGEHTRDSTQGAHNLATNCHGIHVSIAHGGHGHHRPPKSIRDAGEQGVGVISLCKVDSTGEEDHPDEKEEYEEAQLPHAGLESLPQDLQPLGVPGELEDPEDSDQADDSEDGQGHGLLLAPVVAAAPRLLLLLLLLGQLGAQGDEVGDDGHDVDDVHDVTGELGFAGAGEEADEELEGEPDDAQGLDEEEGVGEEGAGAGSGAQGRRSPTRCRRRQQQRLVTSWHCLPKAGLGALGLLAKLGQGL